MEDRTTEALRTSLTPETVTRGEISWLVDACHQVLAEAAVDTVINGRPVRVSEHAHEFTLDRSRYYLRIAQFDAPEGERQKDQDIEFLFDATPDAETIVTPNPYALRLQRMGSSYELVLDNDMKPIVNDPDSFALAQDVVADISTQSMKQRVVRKTLGERALEFTQAAHISWNNYFNDMTQRRKSYPTQPPLVFTTRGGFRKAAWGSVAALSLAGFGHVPFGHVDAHVGPLPLPQPVELIVDMSNEKEHRADGFSPPDQAIIVSANSNEAAIPLVPEYNTDGVPSAKKTKNYDYDSDTMRSRPGLWRVDVGSPRMLVRPGSDAKNGLNTAGEIAEKDSEAVCTNVFGDFYQADEASVFTQDEVVADHAEVTALNGGILQICSDTGEPLPKGTRVYVWHE